jgi:hypothetical protein
MSLDGFIAGPGDAMDWAFKHAGPNPAVEEVIGTLGAVFGRQAQLRRGPKGTATRDAQSVRRRMHRTRGFAPVPVMIVPDAQQSVTIDASLFALFAVGDLCQTAADRETDQYVQTSMGRVELSTFGWASVGCSIQ